MKRFLVAVVLGLLWSNFSLGDNFSKISGDLKYKCVTSDRSFIVTAEIRFNNTDNPDVFFSADAGSWIKNNQPAKIYKGPPNSEQFEIVWTNEITETLLSVYKLVFDSSLLIGNIYNAVNVDPAKPFKATLESQVECVKLLDTASVGGSRSNGTSSGTAFFVSNKGHLLTNNHVVDGCSISKITYQNKDYDTKLLATDKTLDLALLKADLSNKSYFNFSKDVTNKLSKIYVAGYPLGKGLSDDLKITSGIVSSLKGFDDNSNEIQIDAPINPGNSGGPIINENGDLVAIAVSGLAKDQTEGINFGIKSSAAELFLKSNKVTPKKSMYSGIKDNDELLEILEQGTVYTYCD